MISASIQLTSNCGAMGGSFKLMRVGHQRKTSAVTRNSAFTRNTIVSASSKFDSLSFLASSSHTFAGGQPPSSLRDPSGDTATLMLNFPDLL